MLDFYLKLHTKTSTWHSQENMNECDSKIPTGVKVFKLFSIILGNMLSSGFLSK